MSKFSEAVREPRLLTECYGDALLVKFLGYVSTEVHSGVGQIANLMGAGDFRMAKFLGKRAVAVIDDDRIKQKYFKDFVVSGKSGVAQIRFTYRPGTEHIAIIISPALEGWLLHAAKSVAVDPRDYNLPATSGKLKELHTGKLTASDDVNLKNFLNAIVQKNKGPIKILGNYIHHGLNTFNF